MANVFTRQTDILAGFYRGGKTHALVAHFGLFLHDHRVRPGRDRRAGHDAHAAVGRPLAVERRAGEGFPGDRQRRIGRQIGEAHRIAVHRRVSERRHVERRDHRGGGDAAGGGGQGDGFGLLQRGDLPEHFFQRLLQGDEIGSMAMIHKGNSVIRVRIDSDKVRVLWQRTPGGRTGYARHLSHCAGSANGYKLGKTEENHDA